MTVIDDVTAAAYARAIVAARAAVRAGDEAAAPAARDAVADVDAPAELRRIVGALAFLAVCAVPRRVRRGASVAAVLDRLDIEVTWGAS